ncbi:helix-turn-helix domain-containing protein [Micromonospora sp. KLBMP9576]|uniref:helix-turn-helix domain-containing protein n=1 Tax=Micromonospora sp. KLBMP9576 TaxID=3424769 RepID=UPI003D9501F6
MSLLRRVIGGVLRRLRLRQGRTLREVAEAAGVSVPYLSEVERGRKEASSEVLAAICRALGIHLSDLLEEARDDLRRVEPRIPAAPRAGLVRQDRAGITHPDTASPTARVGPRTGGPLLHLGPRAGGPTLRVGRPTAPAPALARRAAPAARPGRFAPGARPGLRTRVALGCARARAGARPLTVG